MGDHSTIQGQFDHVELFLNQTLMRPMSTKSKRSAKVLRAPRGRKTSVKKNNQNYRGAFPMWKSPRMIMPNEYDTTLRYIVTNTVGSAAAVLASIRFQSNAYDVDPALGSTAMAGFTEFAGFYARFRTLGMTYKFNSCNQEAFPVSIIHGFSSNSIATGSLGMNYGEGPLMRTAILGPLTGQCRGTYTQSATTQQIVGTAQALYDDVYTGSTTSSTLPTGGTVYCYFGAAAPTAFTAAGILVQVEINLHIRFYKLNFLTT